MDELLFSISILSGLISFSLYNLGFAFEKKAIQKLPSQVREKTSSMIKAILVNPLWLMGLFLTILSVGFYFVALMWAPLSAVAPLAGFGLVVLVIYAHIDLKESLKKLEIISIVLIIVGISVSSYLISLSNDSIDWNQWKTLAHSLDGYLVFGSSVFVSLVIISFPFLFKKKFSFSGYDIAFSAGIIAGIQAVLIKGLSVWVSNNDWSSELYIFILYIIMVLGSALISTGSLQFAFKEGRVSIIMAIYNGIMTIFPVIFGGFILKEWQSLALIPKIFLGISISVTLLGIVLLSLKHTHSFTAINDE
jgi:uncharacterized membrane protein